VAVPRKRPRLQRSQRCPPVPLREVLQAVERFVSDADGGERRSATTPLGCRASQIIFLGEGFVMIVLAIQDVIVGVKIALDCLCDNGQGDQTLESVALVAAGGSANFGRALQPPWRVAIASGSFVWFLLLSLFFCFGSSERWVRFDLWVENYWRLDPKINFDQAKSDWTNLQFHYLNLEFRPIRVGSGNVKRRRPNSGPTALSIVRPSICRMRKNLHLGYVGDHNK
jgi:hypothetical protein